MRQDIDTAPRDGRAIILEEGPSGTYQIAEWSKEAGAWIDEHGDPVKVTPAYWHALPGENDWGSDHESRGRSGVKTRRMATLIIGIALLAAVGVHARSYIEASGVPHLVKRDVGLYLSKIDQFGRASFETTSVLAAHGLSSVRDFAGSQEWLIQLGRIGDNLAKVWHNEIQRQVRVDHPKTSVVADGIASLAGVGLENIVPELRTAESAEFRATTVSVARPSNSDENAPGQSTEERVQNQAIKGELEIARRQIELNARMLVESRDLARLEQIVIEENGRQHIDSLLRYIEVLRHAQEVNTGALNGARSEAQEHRLRGERAAADARRERDRGRLLAKQLAEARLEIDTKTAMLNELRRNAEKQKVERASAERQKERDHTETMQGD